jgi:NitT/TauT family transport system permease protein
VVSDPSTFDDDEDQPASRSRFRKTWRRFDSIVYPTVAIVAVLVIWDLAVVVFDIAPYLLPKPTAVLSVLIDQRKLLWDNSIPTLQEILAGFALAVVVGIPLAVGIVSSRIFEKTVYPLLVASQTIPKVALAPLFLVWFGFGLKPKILIAFLIAVFPIIVDTAVGLRSVPSEMIDLARSMRASRFALFMKVRFPFALPNVFAGLKVAITLAVIGAVVGEFVGADKGLGQLLVVANGRLETSLMFASVFVLVVIGIISFMIVDIIGRLAMPWHVSVRRETSSFGTS